jgi:hypothetical protein
MMRFSALLFSVVNGLLWSNSLLPQVHAHAHSNSFHRDVISGAARKEHPQLERKHSMQDELLEKAVPIAEYNAQLKSLGVLVEPTSSSSAAEGANGESRRLEEEGEVDDYYLNEQYMYSFSGYSLKYAKCQPIKQFSESALEAGQYSPLVTQDVVILRLCPYKACTSSRQYGCHYNYAEYAIGLFDYIRIMLRYKAEKKASLCEWCTTCLNGRRQLDEAAADDAAAAADDYYKYEGVGDDFYQKNDDTNYYDESDECYMSGTYCKNYYYDCQADDDQNNQQNQNYYQDDYSYYRAQKYIAEDEYFNYLGCTELKDEYGGIYFVRPTCDTSADQIKFSVYYDAYCTESASSLISMDNFQVTFNEAVFEELNEDSCIDCSESVSRLCVIDYFTGCPYGLTHYFTCFFPNMTTELSAWLQRQQQNVQHDSPYGCRLHHQHDLRPF